MSLRSKRAGQSIGAVVSDVFWKTHQARLGVVELIPGVDGSEEMAPIRQSLRKTGLLECDAYNQLRPIQKQWIKLGQVGGHYRNMPDGKTYYDEPYWTVNLSIFEKTTCKTIALEIREKTYFLAGKKIDNTSMEQLISVLNYAHDQGGRRVILINQTSYSPEALLSQIKDQLPQSESERTWSRLQGLLCESEDSIFSLDEFNGHIVTAHPLIPLTLPKESILGMVGLVMGTPYESPSLTHASAHQSRFFSEKEASKHSEMKCQYFSAGPEK